MSPAETSGSLFTAISTNEPNTSLFSKQASTVKIPNNVSSSGPIQTNNFWGNLVLGDQTAPVYTHPYSVWYSTNSNYYGLAVSHQTAAQRILGDNDTEGAASYFYMPAGNMAVVLGSSDFSSKPTIKLANLKKMSVDVTLASPSAGSFTASLVQGMGFVSAVYNDLIPEILSNVGFKSVSGDTAPRSGINKYKIQLQDGSTWVMYVTLSDNQKISFALKDSNHIIGSNSLNNCVIQLACGDFDAYDQAAGSYPTAVTLEGSVSGNTATYSFNYATSGNSNKGTTLMYALPHQSNSFTGTTSGSKTSAQLDDTVHGLLTGYLTNKFEMSESLPTSLGDAPWTSIDGWSSASYTSSQKSAIAAAANDEYNFDVYSNTDLDSMYTSGKILDKYAYVLYVLHYVLNDTDKTKTLLASLKKAIERFSNNKQKYPLVYETNFGGICSSGGLASGDSSIDYGNAYYNDHHFHYGYHIHAAAIVAKVDAALGGSWLNNVKDWVNTLVRDVANPSTNDSHFPVSRNFDYFLGHSIAHGITVYSDGKDEESSSEDYNFTYAMKIWAQVVNDTNMESRANLMLAITKRAMNIYFLYSQDNKVMPSQFIGNYCSGIYFENKISHTTYFGTNLEYIHGIHMLPITPVSSFIRGPTFVKEEWENVLSSRVSSITDGWRGILELNVALYDPSTSYNFFNGSGYNSNYLDNGMSKTWSLAYTAGVSK